MAGTPIEIDINATVNGQKAVDGMALSVDRLGKEAQQTGQQATAAAVGVSETGKAASDSQPHIDNASDGILRFGSVYAKLAAAVAGLISGQLVQAMIQAENLAMGLAAIAKDGEAAGQQLDFVKRMAGNAGVDVIETGKAFLSLQASTKGTAVEGKLANDVFEAVTVSMAKAGKSSAETSLALNALAQMAGKGVVSMEELRGQLGESLPGALPAAAKGMGITVADLTKLVESGKVAAEGIFPARTKGLQELYGKAPDTQTLSAEITNTKNALNEFAVNVAQATPINTVFKTGLEFIQLVLVGLENQILVVGKEIGIFAAALATMDFSNFGNAIAEVEQEAQDKVGRLAEHNSLLQRAMGVTAEQAREMSKAIAESNDTATKAGSAATQSATGYIALSNAYLKVRQELEDAITIADRQLVLARATGEAAVANAKLLGDEKAVRVAVAQSARDQANATAELAAKQQTEADVLKAELVNKKALLSTAGQLSEAKQKELKDLEDLIAKKQIEAATTAQQAAKAEDHARAVSLERTALQDATTAQQALLIAKSADAQANVENLQTQLQLARSSEELARVMGNEEGVRKAKILQLEIEIKLTKAKAEVQRIEAEGSIAVAKAKTEELKAANLLTPLKEAELKASIKLAEAKLFEAKAMGESTAAAEKMLQNLKNGTASFNDFGGSARSAATDVMNFGKQAAQGMDEFTAGIDRTTSAFKQYEATKDAALAREQARQKAEAAAWDKRLGRDSEKFAIDEKGNRITAALPTVEGVSNQLVQRGMDEGSAVEKAKEILAAYQRESMALPKISGMSMSNAESILGGRLQKMIEWAAGGGELGGFGGQTFVMGQQQIQTPQQQPQAAKTYNVVINGQTYKADSDAAAKSLIETLKRAQQSS